MSRDYRPEMLKEMVQAAIIEFPSDCERVFECFSQDFFFRLAGYLSRFHSLSLCFESVPVKPVRQRIIS